MKVTCKQCGTTVPGDDINIQSMAATCRNCSTVFSVRDLIETGDEQVSKQRPRVDMPQGMRVHHSAIERGVSGDPYRTSAAPPTSDVILEWQWWHERYRFIVGFSAAWCAILVLWYSVVLAMGAGLTFILFGLIHAFVGAGLAYVSVALLRNSTRVSLRADELVISFAPMWWFGAKKLSARTIDQMYTEEGVAYTVNDRSVPGYSVYALDRNGAKTRIVKNLPEVEQALYVEQELERALGITDRPVPDEVPR